MTAPSITPGRTGQLTRVVTAEDTAVALGSGDVEVLATPRLIAWMEAATCASVDEALGEGETTVGSRVVVEHLKASPVGAGVVVSATVKHVDGRLLRFEVVAEESGGPVVGHGEITRVRVDRQRFLTRVTR